MGWVHQQRNVRASVVVTFAAESLRDGTSEADYRSSLYISEISNL